MVGDPADSDRADRIGSFQAIATLLVIWQVVIFGLVSWFDHFNLSFSSPEFLVLSAPALAWAAIWGTILVFSFTNKNVVFLLGLLFGVIDILSTLVFIFIVPVFPFFLGSLVGLVVRLMRLLITCRLVYDAYKIRVAPRGGVKRTVATLANPHRFMAFSRWAWPLCGAIGSFLIAAGLWFCFTAPADFNLGILIRILFIHGPAASLSVLAYACLGGTSFFALLSRYALADAAARAVAPLGAAFTLLTLVTGSLWARPLWGVWWFWGDARLSSEVALFVLFVGCIALRTAFRNASKADRAAAILAFVGLIDLPIVINAPAWWRTLHSGEWIFLPVHPTILTMKFLLPLALMGFGYTFAFAALWMERTRAEVWRRQGQALTFQAVEA